MNSELVEAFTVRTHRMASEPDSEAAGLQHDR
jgi:hypothetical protein